MPDFAVRQRPTGRLFVLLAMMLAGLAVSGRSAVSADAADWKANIPKPLIGPYIIDPETLMDLDKSSPDCAAAATNFQCLVFQDDRSKMKAEDLVSNPFTLPVFELVQYTVRKDLH